MILDFMNVLAIKNVRKLVKEYGLEGAKELIERLEYREKEKNLLMKWYKELYKI